VIYHPALPALLGFVALLLIVIPALVWYYSAHLRERAGAGVATIVEKEELPFRGDFHAWVEFAGRRCRMTIPKDTWRELRPGSTLKIRYDPEKPGEVSYAAAGSGTLTNWVCGVLILAGFGVAAIAWRLWFDD